MNDSNLFYHGNNILTLIRNHQLRGIDEVLKKLKLHLKFALNHLAPSEELESPLDLLNDNVFELISSISDTARA